jgi:hypothetical protein
MKGGTKMRFELVRTDTYRARLQDEVYVWVTQQGPNHWWWSLGSATGAHEWGTDFNGPFPDMWGAVADAVARYEGFEDKTIVWWVYRPTYMGQLQSPHLWRLEMVEAGSERDRMLTSRRTVTDAGEVVEIPGDWRRFEDRSAAETWMEEEARRWEEWHSFWIA